MKKLGIETFLQYKYLSELSISPDGKHSAFIVHTASVEDNNYTGCLYLLDNQSKALKQLTSIGSVKQFMWEDDSNIIFPATRDESTKERLKKGELVTDYYRINIMGGEAQPAFSLPLLAGVPTKMCCNKLLFKATYDNNRPDLTGLSTADSHEVLKKYNDSGYTIFEEVPFWFNGMGVINRKRNRLYIYDMTTDSVEPITAPMFEVAQFDVNECNILYTGVEYDDIKPYRPGLYFYNRITGVTKCLIEPDTHAIKLMKLCAPDKAVVICTDNSRFGMGELGDAYIFDLSTGEKTLLAKHNHITVGNSTNSDVRYGGGRAVKVEGDTLYYLTTNVNNGFVNTLCLKTGEVKTITSLGAVDCFDVHGGELMTIGHEVNSLGEVYSVKNGQHEKLTTFNAFVASDYTLSTPEPLTCVNREGMEIYGFVLKPAGYAPGNSYPAILHIHGGPRTVFSDIFHHEMQMWANEGYFVIFANPRGGDGRGDEFADIRAKYGSIDYNDLMDFTDCALEKYSDIDSARVGITGGSYGGFMTNWAIGHTDRFACAVAQRCISNWTTFEGTTDIGYYFGPDQTGASHTDNQQLQWEQSPLKYADKVKTPTLFIHGEQDYRCYMVEVLQMFTALKMHGIPSRVCLLKGENHELSRSGKPQNRIKRMEEIVAWMNNYLK